MLAWLPFVSMLASAARGYLKGTKHGSKNCIYFHLQIDDFPSVRMLIYCRVREKARLVLTSARFATNNIGRTSSRPCIHGFYFEKMQMASSLFDRPKRGCLKLLVLLSPHFGTRRESEILIVHPLKKFQKHLKNITCNFELPPLSIIAFERKIMFFVQSRQICVWKNESPSFSRHQANPTGAEAGCI